MTNSSPQDPQKPIPERRRKPATGVTFDEMVAIIVAFSTIGAILFWILGGRKGEIAGNFGLGGQNSALSGDDVGIGIASIKANSDLELSELETDSDRLIIANNSSLQKSVALVPASSFNTGSVLGPNSYQLDTRRKLVPLAGVAVVPGLIDRPDLDRNVVGDRAKTPVTTTPKKPETPVTTAPKKAETPVATTPEKVEIPDDIVPSYWAYPFVKQMSGKGLVPDFSDDQNFEPNKLITRAGMATLISQAFDYKAKNEGVKQFRDVSDDNAIAADVNEAVRMGFMQGYSENTFRPLENIPRYQVLVTLATGLGLKPSGDPDQILQKLDGGTDIPDWAKEQVAAAAESGLIVNRPEFANNSLNPNESATRGEVAAMIHQALVKTGKLKSIDSEYILKP